MVFGMRGIVWMEISSLHCCRWERHFLCCEQQTSTENSLFEEILLKASAWEPQATALISTWWIHSRTGKKKKHKTTLLLCALCEVLIEFTICFVCAIPFLISVGKDYNEAKDKNHNGQTRNKINNHQANCRKKKKKISTFMLLSCMHLMCLNCSEIPGGFL